MRFTAIGLAGALLIAAAAAWLWVPAKPAPPSIEQPTPVHESVSAGLPAEAVKGRDILTKAQLDQALVSGILDRRVKSLLAVDKPLQFGDFVWNDTAIPAGATWIRIDLGTQLISVFRDGHEIGTSVIVYGGDNKQTPGGKFHILAKDKDHRSSLYDAAMPYTLQLTGDGVSIHGSVVRWGAATHGCIGVPLEFARRLFDEAKVGDEVIIVPVSRNAAAATS